MKKSTEVDKLPIKLFRLNYWLIDWCKLKHISDIIQMEVRISSHQSFSCILLPFHPVCWTKIVLTGLLSNIAQIIISIGFFFPSWHKSWWWRQNLSVESNNDASNVLIVEEEKVNFIKSVWIIKCDSDAIQPDNSFHSQKPWSVTSQRSFPEHAC